MGKNMYVLVIKFLKIKTGDQNVKLLKKTYLWTNK